MDVKVYPDTDTRHVSQIYAGLYDLAAQGKINLEFIRSVPQAVTAPRPLSLWLTVNYKKVCFDMADFCQINSVERLHECDSYFKRSYDRTYLKTIDVDLRRKVHPYGLNYACRSRFERHLVRRLLIYIYAHSRQFGRPAASARTLKLGLRALIAKYGFDPLTPLVSDLEVKPDKPAEPVVLFQTRTWGLNETKLGLAHHKKLNDMRVNTVRALRSEFGKRFIGGLANTKLARKHYPDVVVTNTKQKHYLSLVRGSLVGVTTIGLHYSTGWKLPEFLAASRCIVTEPLKFELPTPLVEGENYLSFRTPEGCVEACKRILNEPTFAQRMRQNNWQYYLREVKPSSLIWNCLRKALTR